VIAASIALVGFGLDPVIELFSATIVIWQLRSEIAGQDLETRAVRLIRATFFVLAACLTVNRVRNLLRRLGLRRPSLALRLPPPH
jgi:hypothetical protein